MAKTKKKTRVLWRRVSVVLGIIVLATVTGLGGYVWATLHVEQVTVQGAQHADVEAIHKLAGIDTTQRLYGIDSQITADRIQREPWVAAAVVKRLPTGTLALNVVERTPVLLALAPNGKPDRYLDAQGYQMPVVDGAAYDVPLLRGLKEAYHPVKPIAHPGVRALLAEIGTLPEGIDQLLSTFYVVGKGLELETAPGPRREGIRVRLGEGDFTERLHHLRAFWDQAILTRPKVAVNLIDLRFNNQIVTQEKARTE